MGPLDGCHSDSLAIPSFCHHQAYILCHIDGLFRQACHFHHPAYKMQTTCHQDLDLARFLLGTNEPNRMFDARYDMNVILGERRH